MTTFTKTTATDYLETIHMASNDISACVGQEIKGVLLANHLYILWCLYDMLDTPSEYKVRKGAEPLVDKMKAQLAHLFKQYDTRLQAVGIQNMVAHMLHPTATGVGTPAPKMPLGQTTRTVPFFVNGNPHPVQDAAVWGLTTEGKYYDVVLNYADGSTRTLTSSQEITICLSDDVFGEGYVSIEFYGGANSIEVPFRRLMSLHMTEVPPTIAAWLSVDFD